VQTTSPTSAPHGGFAQRRTRPTLDHGSVGNSQTTSTVHLAL
jgi:hypothetical protein